VGFYKACAYRLWPEILVVGIIVFFFVAVLVVARLEKHFIHQFEPAGPDEMPPRSSYFLAMNEAASSLGYRHCGNFLQSCNSSLYQCCLALWLSADQNILLVIVGGKMAKMDYKRTLLISVARAEKILVTVDDFGSAT